MSGQNAFSASEHYKALVKNITSLDFTGVPVPCNLLLTGENAFPIVVDNKGQVLIAASHYGTGRIVVVAHEAYVSSPRFTQFIENAIEWLKPSLDSLVGIHKAFSSTAQFLTKKGHDVEPTFTFYRRYGVYCMHAYDDRQSSELIWALKEGSGLLIAGQAWHWMSQNESKNVLLDYPGNKVTSVTGIQFLKNYGQKDVFSVTPEMPLYPLYAKYKWDMYEDIKQIMNGITDLRILDSGTASHLLIHGQRAFPLVLDESNKTYLAACYYGKGRVIVATHENQISGAHQKQLIPNLISWLDAGRNGTIGLHGDLSDLHARLHEDGIPSQFSDVDERLSVYCCTSYENSNDKKIQEFVAEGGGLLIGGQAWYWSLQNPGVDELINYPGNKIIKPFGISMVAGGRRPSKLQPVDAHDLSQSYQCRKALSQLQNVIDSNQNISDALTSWMVKLGEDCATILAIEDTSQTFYSIKNALVNLLLKLGMPAVSKENPVIGRSKEAFLLRLAAGLRNTYPNYESIVATLIPEPSTLPVSPPRTLEINGINKGQAAWRSTGLYIPPGKIARVTFPTDAVNIGLEVQVGCHSDDLSDLPELKRSPVVIQKYLVNQTTLPVSNIFGGLLYIIIPGNCYLEQITITVEEAVLAPYFKHGETTIDSWVEEIRHYSSPWAELETEKIIFTIPSSIIVSLMDPVQSLSLWDKIMEANFRLSGLSPLDVRPERFVADVQISQGWMHSGYPIIVHLESAKGIVKYNEMFKRLWGATHELGHNQCLRAWELPPHTDEALCNLWAIYAHETVLGIQRVDAHLELDPQIREDRIKKHFERGAPLEEWTEWVCLEPYLQLQERFGWDPYMKLFSEYQNMVDVKEDNHFKMNLWAELFSQKVEKNLIPFFKSWNWPISEETTERLSSLPEWSENPMEKYIQ